MILKHAYACASVGDFLGMIRTMEYYEEENSEEIVPVLVDDIFERFRSSGVVLGKNGERLGIQVMKNLEGLLNSVSWRHYGGSEYVREVFGNGKVV